MNSLTKVKSHFPRQKEILKIIKDCRYYYQIVREADNISALEDEFSSFPFLRRK